MGSLPLAAEPELDFLRFKNGDTLHGRYQGLDEGPLVKWKSAESEDPIHFETRNLRKLSLNNGRAQNHLESPGLVTLNNGDQLPGSLVAMDADSVSLQTDFAGLLTIPRKDVERIYPNRNGSGVLYAGPFNKEDWSVPGTPVPDDEDAPPPPQDADDAAAAEEDPPSESWVYGSAAWYNNSSDILRLDKPLPAQVSIRFKLTWQAPLSATIAVFSDFQRPAREEPARVRRVPDPAQEDEPNEDEAEEPEEKAAEEPPAFVDIMKEGVGSSEADKYGGGYILNILSNYSKLQRLSFDDNEKARKTSFPNSGGRINLGDLFSADFEIRANREEGKVSLFVNGEFYSEWQDLEEPLEETDRYFAVSAGGKSRLRISDVVIAEWNGMPDSARSMETEERDVLLLANGIDRFSGKILTLEKDVFQVESDYGVFQVPVREVTDIQLATDSVAEAPEPQNEEIKISFQPNGLLTFLPKEGLAENLNGAHPILGDLSLDLTYAYLLEFDPIGSIFDNWDDEF